MPSMTQVEWLNGNSLRAYPFSENSTRIPNDPSGGGLLGPEYAIPNYAVVDVVASLPYMDPSPSLFVSSLSLAGGILTIVLSAHRVVDGGGSDSIVASVSVSTSSSSFRYAEFSGTGDYEGARGAVVFGDLARMDGSFPDGIYLFDRSQTTLEARCVRPSARCVSGIRVSSEGGAYSTRTLFGDVSLIAGSNIRLSYVPESNAIRIDADSNEGYNDRCSCDGSDSAVRTINGISVSDVTIEGGDCISVETSNGRITISDTCSKPCCGCEELNFLNSKANELSTASTRLLSLAGALSERLSDFKESYLQSERSPTQTI